MTTDRDAQIDAIAAELEAAGLLTISADAEGHVTYTLTRAGAAVGREPAMTAGEDERLSIIDDLLDAAGPFDT